MCISKYLAPRPPAEDTSVYPTPSQRSTIQDARRTLITTQVGSAAQYPPERTACWHGTRFFAFCFLGITSHTRPRLARSIFKIIFRSEMFDLPHDSHHLVLGHRTYLTSTTTDYRMSGHLQLSSAHKYF
ncbi:hypothetical protein ONS96_008735 [Cadophora gregata f. sp. sojae]|nr:hypothetical protein ONS96_008735 [Cadophora gregata f. sp. sojae]